MKLHLAKELVEERGMYMPDSVHISTAITTGNYCP